MTTTGIIAEPRRAMASPPARHLLSGDPRHGPLPVLLASKT
jgi:hypothetical protein